MFHMEQSFYCHYFDKLFEGAIIYIFHSYIGQYQLENIKLTFNQYDLYLIFKLNLILNYYFKSIQFYYYTVFAIDNLMWSEKLF